MTALTVQSPMACEDRDRPLRCERAHRFSSQYLCIFLLQPSRAHAREGREFWGILGILYKHAVQRRLDEYKGGNPAGNRAGILGGILGESGYENTMCTEPHKRVRIPLKSVRR